MKKILLLFTALANITFAIAQTVESTSLNFLSSTSSSPEEILTGRVSGMWISRTDGNIASDLYSSIRGIGSMYGESGPLWVIDGVVLSDTEAQRVNSFFRSEYAPYQQTSNLNALSFLNLYDIESIEVLKDVSATAIYGSKGANGVVLIKTKSAHSKDLDINWDSNVGLEMSGLGLSPSFCHNHNLAVNAMSNRAKYFLSAYYRDSTLPVHGANDNVGGVRVKFDTQTNQYIWFGFNANLSVGRQSSMLASSELGNSSMGTALRGLVLPTDQNSIDGWASDYDDINKVFRTTFEAHLRINFLPVLYWETKAGADLSNNTRNHWFGLNTQFGAMKSRAGSYAVSSVKRYNAKSSLVYDMVFMDSHKLGAEVAVVFEGDKNRFEINSADHFLTDALRGDGMAFRESAPHPYWLSYSLNEFGAYGVLKYSFNEAIHVSAQFRADNCNRYDDSAFSLYPSANASIDLHRLFFREATIVSKLKLDGGFGIAGMKHFVPYQALDRFIDQQNLDEALKNNDIVINIDEPQSDVSSFLEGFTKTKTSEYNIGASIGLFSDRIRITGRYYDRKSESLFNLYSFGKLSESSTHVWKKCSRWDVYEESRSVTNSGVETDIEADIVRSNQFNLSVIGNLSYNKWTGASDLTFNPVPSILTGVGIRCAYKGFTAEVWGNGAFGHQICNLNRMYSDSLTNATDCIEDAGYFNISMLAASYKFDIRSIKFIKSITASIVAGNLLTMTKYSGLNPNVNSYIFQGNKMMGYDYGSLPSATSLMFGLSVRF